MPRVHALLYFLCPVGHGLKPLDLELMQRLGDSVNIIPVISKADTFTRTEMETFKQNVGSQNPTQHCNFCFVKVRGQLKSNNIKLFDFGHLDCDEDVEMEAPPFAVVASNVITRLEDGRTVRGREYPWGVVNIEDKVLHIL